MVRLSLSELADICGGSWLGAEEEVLVTGAEFDSRAVKGGELFVALPGSNVHGHKFVESALERGAAGCLIEDEEFGRSSSAPERMVLVKDSLKAFWQLARWWRKELALPVLAVTGSVGKTSVKEFCASILLKHSRGTYAFKSHNNHVGVPYTLCRASREDSWIVLEIGMNHQGEIRELVRIAEPNVGVITCVAPAHLEFLGSLENIADAKWELVEGISGGTLVLPEDDPLLRRRADQLDPEEMALKFFGESEECDLRLVDYEGRGLTGSRFALVSDRSERCEVQASVIGRHAARNAACAVLACRSLLPTLTLEEACRGIVECRSPAMRLRVRKLKTGAQIIDDSYNASPTSLRAALEVLGDEHQAGRSVAAVLGDMLELGPDSERYHREIGELLVELAPKVVVGVGPQAAYYLEAVRAAGGPVFHVETPIAAANVVKKYRFERLLVKGSRAIGLEQVVEHLVEREGEVLASVSEEEAAERDAE